MCCPCRFTWPVGLPVRTSQPDDRRAAVSSWSRQAVVRLQLPALGGRGPGLQPGPRSVRCIYYFIIIDRFYIALFSALEQTHCARMWFYMSEYLYIARFWISTEVVYLQRWHGWCHMKLLPSRRVLCTPDNHAPCHFMQSHIRKVYACLAVTCHLHFWQNDRGLLRATAVTREWNGYRNKSQHRKLILEMNIFLPLLQGFEPATFRSRVRRSNHWAIPAPWVCRYAVGCIMRTVGCPWPFSFSEGSAFNRDLGQLGVDSGVYHYDITLPMTI